MYTRRSGLTLIELLVVVAIIAILVAIVFSTGIIGGKGTFQAEVTEKWTDVDYEGNRVYRVRTVKPSGEVDTWNSYWCHDNVQVGVSYQFSYRGSYLSDPQRLAVQPQKAVP